MTRYDRDIIKLEKNLIKEISEMKFSFKKIVKVIELDAILSYYGA